MIKKYEDVYCDTEKWIAISSQFKLMNGSLHHQIRPLLLLQTNARNMDVAVRKSGLGPHVRCLAHNFKFGQPWESIFI